MSAKVVANIKYANLIAMRSALVEEDGSGISVDSMLVANALVHCTIHCSKVHRATDQCAGLNKNIHCEKSLFVLASRQKIPVLRTENTAVDTRTICLLPIELF